MLMDGIEYQLVEKGSIENAFLFGLFMGIIMIGAFVALYLIGKRTLFRKYYQTVDNATRNAVLVEMKEMADDADTLANQTNTLFFKSLANEFHSLLNELNRH
jgi:predicted membrane-bound dolichyl-phosphate-mannose-protein mannosyltransferase